MPFTLPSLLLLVSTVFATPLYKQCDPRWGNDTIGTPNGADSTICHVGCAMTSLSMLLASVNTTTTWLKESQRVVTPKSLNMWLRHNHGYDCVQVSKTTECFDLLSSAIANLTGRISYDGYTPTPPTIEEMHQQMTTNDKAYIAHVHNHHHFVLVTAVDVQANTVLVLDPYYNTTIYPYENVSGALVYTLRTQSVPFQYPTYKQCAPQWGPDVIFNETVCQVGCLMSSTSMALAGHGIDVDALSSNPGTLNNWLVTHHGYTEHNDFEESALSNVSSLLPKGSVVWPSDGMELRRDDIGWDELTLYLKRPRVVIANVLKGRHFVLVVGQDLNDLDTLFVNDPGFNKTTYSYMHDVVGWRLFDMK